jgi:uncharacterized membrane protein
MTKMKTWHKISLGIAVLLAIVSWILAFYYWGKLPTTIPTHFGFSGQADSWGAKSILQVFLIPFIQSLITGGFIFLYYKPQYSDMPTTLWLLTMDPKIRDHAFDLIRTMLVGTGVWISVLFTYIVYTMNESAMNSGIGMNTWFLFGLVGGMIIWLILWTIKVYHATREAIKTRNS